MSHSFQPRSVPSDIIARWPAMALSLWKRSFQQQAIILLATALAIKLFPVWSTLGAFLVAPSLFVIAFATVQLADEKARFSWWDLVDVLPGALRLGWVTLQFAAGFGVLAGALAGLSSALVQGNEVAAQQAAFADAMMAPHAGAMADAADVPDNLLAEFFHFCATWTQGIMAMVFLGMFIVAIYQGVFGAVLHAQQGMGPRESRIYGWQAWQVNAGSIEQALREAPAAFWLRLAVAAATVICSFQTVYFSPFGLVLASYIPCLAYVAYRSIFLGKHENVPATKRATVRMETLVPARVRGA